MIDYSAFFATPNAWPTPPLRVEGPLIPLGNLPTACPDESVSMAQRVDPFWSSIWAAGTQASWIDARTARKQQLESFARIPYFLSEEAGAADQQLVSVKGLPRRLDILAVLRSYRTATAEQLAAFTGHAGLAAGQSETMRTLFASELVDVGIPSSALIAIGGPKRPTLYRENRGDLFDRKLDAVLTYPEWMSVTGGAVNRIGGGSHDRHNVLTTELALRIAEVCDVGAVLGELHSSVDLLGYTSLGRESRGPKFNSAADMTILRNDGLRIAVELTASVTHGLERKVEAWCELLSERRMDESGLAVLFVLADKRAPGIEANSVRNALFQAIRKATRRVPGRSFDRVASKIAIADWREWFPTPGHVSPSFFNLACERPTGPNDALWERAEFLTETSLPFRPTSGHWTAALDNIALLRAVPAWMREGRNPPEMWRVLLRRSGRTAAPQVRHLDKEFDGPPASREAAEVGSAALPPKRLRSILS